MFGMSKPKAKAEPAKMTPARSHAKPEGEAAVEVTLALTPAQADKLERLGGAKWIGQQIDKAKPAKTPD